MFMRLRKLIAYWRAEEKMPNAFFKMSRSSLTIANSLRNCATSIPDGFKCPLPGNISASAPAFS